MKWGIMATGNIAHQFADTVRQMGDAETVVSVSSRTAERAEEFAAEFGIPKYFGSHAALAADPDTEAVYVAAPNQMHFDLVRLCL